MYHWVESLCLWKCWRLAAAMQDGFQHGWQWHVAEAEEDREWQTTHGGTREEKSANC